MRNPNLDTRSSVCLFGEKTFCDVTLASKDSDKFEAVILAAHSYVLNIMIVNKKKPRPLVFVGGIKAKVLKAMSNELFIATEYKYQTGNYNLGYYIFSFVLC